MRVVSILVLVLVAFVLVVPPLTCKVSLEGDCGQSVLVTLNVCHAGMGVTVNADSAPYIPQNVFNVAQSVSFHDYAPVSYLSDGALFVSAIERPPQA
jgi:hypothetical protein